jgi:putative monooxygenase
MSYRGNIEKAALNNNLYRKDIHSTDTVQLVVMCLKKGENIPDESHPEITQVIQVVSGRIVAEVDSKAFRLGKGDIVVIPPGARHRIRNTHSSDTRLFSTYSPPEY